MLSYYLVIAMKKKDTGGKLSKEQLESIKLYRKNRAEYLKFIETDKGKKYLVEREKYQKEFESRGND